jgi:predicted lipoprotein with Yx(FWY)xxD motif
MIMTTLGAATLVLAACGNGSSGSGSSNAGSSTTAGTSSSSAAPAELSTAKTSLGTVVVDAKGRTVYEFDKDTVGSATTACAGPCIGLWPQVTTTSDAPTVKGLTGKIGTAPNADGSKQLTLNGYRLYTFSGDSQAGQVNGQAFMNIWWVLSPAGQLIKASAGAASSSGTAAGTPSY